MNARTCLTSSGAGRFLLALLLVGTLVGPCPRAAADLLKPGDLVFVDWNAKGLGVLDFETGVVDWIASGFLEPNDVAVAPDQKVYVLDHGGGHDEVDAPDDVVVCYDLKNHTCTTVFSQPSSWRSFYGGIAVGPDGGLFVAKYAHTEQGVQGTVFRIDPDTLAQRQWSVGVMVFRLMAAATGELYVTDSRQSAILRLDPVTGSVVTISQGQYLCDPWSLAMDAKGDLYVVDSCAGEGGGAGAVIHIDPKTGVQTLLARGALDVEAGNYLCSTFGIAFDSYGGIYVADGGGGDTFGICGGPQCGCLVAVDPRSGNQTLLAAGPGMICPIGVAVVPDQVEVIALEVNQAVQDWQNSVPLIAGKKTIVRAHLQTTGEKPVRVTARLQGWREGAALPQSPLPAINPGGFIDASTNAVEHRAEFGASLNFELPPEWTQGTVRLRLAWQNGYLVGKEPAEAAGGKAGDCEVQVAFKETAQPDIQYVAVRWTDTNGVVHEPNSMEANRLASRLDAIWPMPTIGFADSFELDDRSPDAPNFDLLSTRLEAMADLEALRGRRCLFYGYVADSTEGGLAFDIGSRAAVGQVPDTPYDLYWYVHAHELAHCLGLEHTMDYSQPTFPATNWHHWEMPGGVFLTNWVPEVVELRRGHCGEVASATAPEFLWWYEIGGTMRACLGPMDAGDEGMMYGLDTAGLMVVNPKEHFELMSYCEGLTTGFQWISGVTLDRLRVAIDERFRSVSAARRAGVTSDGVLIRGEVNPHTGEVTFLPALPAPGAGDFTLDGPGDYALDVRDAAGVVLHTAAFGLRVAHTDPPKPFPPISFAVAVPADLRAREFVVRYKATPLATNTARATAPTVRILHPNGGEVLGGETAVIQWEGSGGEGDGLRYLLEYSADGGGHWEVLDVDLAEPSYTLESRRLKATRNGLIRVAACAGFRSATAQSAAPFTVPNRPPELALWRPLPGAHFTGAQQIVFEAGGREAGGAGLARTNVQWFSSLDGLLGEGPMLHRSAFDLSEGRHVIQVMARDRGGLTNSVSVSITIGRVTAPRLVRLEPLFTGELYLRAAGDPFVPHVLESSPDLRGWTATATNASRTGVLEFYEPSGVVGSNRFYRVVARP